MKFRIFAPNFPWPKRKRGKRKVIRFFKRMPDGRFLIAGRITKTPNYYSGERD